MRRLGLSLLVGLGVCVAAAEPPFLETFKEYFGPLKGAIAKAECLICHTKPPVRHVFGRTVQAEMAKQRVRRLSADVLQAVETADSDGDGWSNGDEIRAGMLPGDGSSVPVGVAPGPTDAAKPNPEPRDDEGAALDRPSWTKHAFHPLVVHFPIALFLFGTFIDVLGSRRGDSSLRRLATWNLGFAAIGSVAAGMTGLIAFLQLGFSYEGIYLWHLILGVVATTCMIACALMKKKDPEIAGSGYWGLIAIGVLATAIGGHLGATIVFG